MLKAFKEFAMKGNMLDMAVGIVIGAAFGTVVKSLVDNIIMPPIGKLTADIDFSKIVIPLGGETEDGEPVVIGIGQFLNDTLSFVIIAFALFIVIKKVLAAFEKEKEEEPEPEPAEDVVLLTEIRDLLKSK